MQASRANIIKVRVIVKGLLSRLIIENLIVLFPLILREFLLITKPTKSFIGSKFKNYFSLLKMQILAPKLRIT